MADLNRSTLERLGHDSLVDICLGLMDDLTQTKMEANDALARRARDLSAITDQVPYQRPGTTGEAYVHNVAAGMKRLRDNYGMTYDEIAKAVGVRLSALGVDVADLSPTGTPEGPENAPGEPQDPSVGESDDPQPTGNPPEDSPSVPDVPHSGELDRARLVRRLHDALCSGRVRHGKCDLEWQPNGPSDFWALVDWMLA